MTLISPRRQHDIADVRHETMPNYLSSRPNEAYKNNARAFIGPPTPGFYLLVTASPADMNIDDAPITPSRPAARHGFLPEMRTFDDEHFLPHRDQVPLISTLHNYAGDAMLLGAPGRAQR